MQVAAFDYELPPERIAQRPAKRRDHSRLMVLRGVSGATPGPRFDPGRDPGVDSNADFEPAKTGIEHRRFCQLPEILRPGDLLVVNDVRVVPARLEAKRATGGAVELLMLCPSSPGAAGWRALARPARRLRAGDTLDLADGTSLRVVEVGADGERIVEAPTGMDMVALIDRLGCMPLPPYIHAGHTESRVRLDRERYQTVYAAAPGAVAAPTAGLHFTSDLLTALRRRDVEVSSVTLHVGVGTFRPITVERVEDHVMDAEAYEIPAATAAAVRRARKEGRRVVAVGTTSVRTLEHAARADGVVAAGAGSADVYVRPGYRFQVVDAMITNFHLPRSTPLMMVAALVGRTRLLDAYANAIASGYRFYSYGDAMLLIP